MKPKKITTRYSRAIKLEEIRTHPMNPRKGNLDAIKASIEKNGWYGALVVQKSTGRILAGNHRYLAAVELGFKTLPGHYVDVTDEEATRILLADNRTSDIGKYNKQSLVDLLATLDQDLEGTGYNLGHLDVAGLVGRHSDKKDRTNRSKFSVELRDPLVASGDLIELRSEHSEHRLIVGDATDAPTVERLMSGETPPVLMVTDPPYGVNYDPNWRFNAGLDQRPGNRKGVVDGDDRTEWAEAYLHSGAQVIYVWHAGRNAKEFAISIEKAGYDIVSQIIWAKPSFALSRGNYHWQHEPCWYAVRKGSKQYWNGGRDQSTLWQISNRKSDAEETGYGHSTQKPLEVMGRPIRNHLRTKNQRVYDPFLGSGTTMLAAHRMRRSCLAVEINPAYADVAIRRMIDDDPTLRILINGILDDRYVPVG